MNNRELSEQVKTSGLEMAPIRYLNLASVILPVSCMTSLKNQNPKWRAS